MQRKGKGGMIWEINTETCIAICKIDDQCKLDAWRRALKAGALRHPYFSFLKFPFSVTTSHPNFFSIC